MPDTHTHTHTRAHTHTKMLRVCVVDSQEVGGKGLYGDEILPFLSKMDVVVMLRGPSFKDSDASLSLSKILETYAGVPMSHMFVRNKDSTHSTVVANSTSAKLARWHALEDGSLHLLISVLGDTEKHVALRAAPWTSDTEHTDTFFYGAEADAVVALVASDSPGQTISYTDSNRASTEAMDRWGRSVHYIALSGDTHVTAAPISLKTHHPAVDDDDDFDAMGDTVHRKTAVPVEIQVRFAAASEAE